jgi:hypothetical protein
MFFFFYFFSFLACIFYFFPLHFTEGEDEGDAAEERKAAASGRATLPFTAHASGAVR